MTHERNESCIIEINGLKQRADKIDDRLTVLNDKTRDITQSHINLLDRMDKKHRRVDSMETTLNELNATTLTELE